MASVGTTSSMRNGMMGMAAEIPRSTSRITCGERFECIEKISSSTRLSRIAWTIALAQLAPGKTSRGAIQQRTPLASRVAQAASAVVLSSDE